MLVAPVHQMSLGQESDVNFREEPRITQSLLSRNQLNRLLKQAPRTDRNPLRKTTVLPGTIINDPSVARTSWQEPAGSASGFVVNQQTKSPPISDVPKIDKITSPKVSVSNKPAPLQPTETAPPSDQTNSQPSAPAVFGPEPSPEMISKWAELDLLTAGSLDDIEVEIAHKLKELDSAIGIDEAKQEQRQKLLNAANEAVNEAAMNQ